MNNVINTVKNRLKVSVKSVKNNKYSKFNFSPVSYYIFCHVHFETF